MSASAIGRWQLRHGIVHFTSHTWKWPGHLLTYSEHLVGVRWREHGWLIMPLYNRANPLWRS
jgi:hypothetical protein